MDCNYTCSLNGVQYVWYENFIKKNIDILEYTLDVYYTKE